MRGHRAAPLRSRAPGSSWRTTATAPAVVLFACLFSAQGALLVLSPILPQVAADFGVTTALAAQLRTLSGLVAGLAALWLGMRSPPRALRQMLMAGVALMAASTAASAVAPTFVVLAVAQVALGVALAIVLSSGLAAASEWAPDNAARTLSWALVGQPAAWIAGMPLVGAVAEVGWRYAWLALPFAASVVAFVLLALRQADAAPSSASDEPSVWHQPGARGWAVGELFAYSGWAGTLVFAGALFVESYGTTSTTVGVILAAAAIAYLPGNFMARRWVDRKARTILLGGALTSAVGVAAFGAVDAGPAWSLALLAALAVVAGARTIAGSSLGLALAPRCRLQAMSVRTAAVQGGYLLGAGLGGAALAVGGYPALGVALSGLYLAAAAPHAAVLLARRAEPGDAAPRPAPSGHQR